MAAARANGVDEQNNILNNINNNNSSRSNSNNNNSVVVDNVDLRRRHHHQYRDLNDNTSSTPSASPSSHLNNNTTTTTSSNVNVNAINHRYSAGGSLMNKLDNYIIVDIGANLTNKKFSRDLDSVIQRAKDSGVNKIMVTGTSLQGSKDALRLSRLYPGVLYCTAGIHPHDAKSWDEETESELRDILCNPECVAVGECGLDFNRNFSPPDVQLEVFEKQVKMACETGKPLFLHERDAHTEVVEILRRHKERLPSAVIHCFTGKKDEAETYLQMGLYIGLTGYLWKDKSENGVRKILEDKIIPLDRLLVETDAPFMYPNTRASKLPQNIKDSLTERSVTFLQRYCTFQRNEPCSLPVTVEMISAYLKKTPEEIALATTINALKLFGLSG